MWVMKEVNNERGDVVVEFVVKWKLLDDERDVRIGHWQRLWGLMIG